MYGKRIVLHNQTIKFYIHVKNMSTVKRVCIICYFKCIIETIYMYYIDGPEMQPNAHVYKQGKQTHKNSYLNRPLNKPQLCCNLRSTVSMHLPDVRMM